MVLTLQDGLRMVNMGAKKTLLEWPLGHLNELLPDDDKIEEAVDLVMECMTFRDAEES